MKIVCLSWYVQSSSAAHLCQPPGHAKGQAAYNSYTMRLEAEIVARHLQAASLQPLFLEHVAAHQDMPVLEDSSTSCCIRLRGFLTHDVRVLHCV